MVETLKERLKGGSFIKMVELDPPSSFSVEVVEDIFNYFDDVDVINVADCPLAKVRISSLIYAKRITEMTNKETLFHMTCRDRNIIGIKSDLLAARMEGLSNILVLTGDPPKEGKSVYEVNSVGLVEFIKRNFSEFTVGVAFNPYARDFEGEVEKLRLKVEKGADFVITQPIFDLVFLDSILASIKDIDVPVIVGVMFLKNLSVITYMRNNLGIEISPKISKIIELEGMGGGVRVARDILAGIVRETNVAGSVIFPMNNFKILPSIMKPLINHAKPYMRKAIPV